MDRLEVNIKLDRMAEIKKDQDTLKSEWSELEAYFLKLSNEDLQDTKLKSVAYTGDKSRITATMAESLKITYPSFLKTIFGSAYSDVITEETKYKVSAQATRMITGLWTNSYTKMSLAEVINDVQADDKTKTALNKKIKGASFNTDKKNFMSIAGMDDDTAEHYAYFAAEAVVWENFLKLMKVTDKLDEASIKETLELLDGAVVVEETPKIAFELIG